MNKGQLLLVGLDNPQSRDPRYALFPRPTGCAGNRLFKMMQAVDPTFTERHYINIAKTNLFPVGKSPSRKHLMAMGRMLRLQLFDSGLNVVLCGVNVRDAVMYEGGHEPMSWFISGGAKFAWIPHPSGRNRQLNSKKMQKRVGEFLIETVRSES